MKNTFAAAKHDMCCGTFAQENQGGAPADTPPDQERIAFSTTKSKLTSGLSRSLCQIYPIKKVSYTLSQKMPAVQAV
jgi:hypothetical protein